MVGVSSRARKAAVSRSRAFIAKRGERQISSMRLSSPGQRSPQVTVRYIGGEVRGCPSNHAICRRGKSTPARRSRCSRSEEHTSELQSLMRKSYAVFCLKKKKTQKQAKIL